MPIQYEDYIFRHQKVAFQEFLICLFEKKTHPPIGKWTDFLILVNQSDLLISVYHHIEQYRKSDCVSRYRWFNFPISEVKLIFRYRKIIMIFQHQENIRKTNIQSFVGMAALRWQIRWDLVILRSYIKQYCIYYNTDKWGCAWETVGVFQPVTWVHNATGH